MLRLPSDSLSWTLMEKIRLLELFMNKDILWEGRAEILQNEFTQRPSNFFTVQNIRQELHQIFITPNPEHVYGLPLHPRGKEAAEMWLKHFRKELTKQRELQKQMFAVSMRRHLDLIKRFQQGKLPRQEIEAILTEARERDAQRPDRELYEAKLKEMLDKIRLDDLDNIRTFSDYYSYLRGERVPTPPPEPVEKTLPKSPTPDLLKSPLHSPELILKDIKNNTLTTMQTQEHRTMTSTSEMNERTATITFLGNVRQNEEFPVLGDFLMLEDDESNEITEVEICSSKFEFSSKKQFLNGEIQEKEDLNKIVDKNLIQEEKDAPTSGKMEDEKLIDREDDEKIENLIEEENKEDQFKIRNDNENREVAEYNDDMKIEKKDNNNKSNKSEINGDKVKKNVFEEEESDEIMKKIEQKEDVIVLNTDGEEEENIIFKEDNKIVEETSEVNSLSLTKAVENVEIIAEDDEIIVDFVKINKEEKVLDEEKNVLIEKKMEKSFQESFIHSNLEFGKVSIEEKVAEIVFEHSNMEYAKLSSRESTLEKINQSIQMVKKLDGQDKNTFMECVYKIVQCASVEEKVIVPPLPITNSLEEPMTSTKAAQINALETELIEPTQTIKQSQRRRQKSTSQNSQKGKLTKTQQKKPQQLPTTKTAIEALPPPPRNLRSSTAKKKIEVEKEVATTILKTEEEENKTVAEVEDVAIPAFVGSKKRKRNVIEFLKPPMTDTSDQIHEEGPPAKNLRRSSHSSPSSQTSTGKKSSQSVTVTKQESSSLIPEVPSSKEIEQPTEAPIKIEQEVIEHPVLPIRTPPPPLQLSTPTLHSQVAATAKLRSSLRRAALASATPSPAVDSVGTNGLFLRPGNHSSSEVIPKEVLLTLWKDIRTHRHSYVFDQPVEEEEVPGYHSAIKKPMDLNTLCQLIESSTIQTFSQFTHHILKIFANAVMYNSTGHHVNTCAKEMLAYALKCIEVVQYPSGQWSAGIFSTPVFGTSVSRQSIASESDGPFDGQLSRSSSGISCSQTPSTSNATKTSTQQKLLRSSSINKRSRETSKTKAIPSPASSSTSSHSETKKEPEDDKQISIVPKNETLPKKRKLHRT